MDKIDKLLNPGGQPAAVAGPSPASKKTAEQIDKAAAGFESLLLHQMLKGMWETVDSSGFLGETSNQAQIFRDMFHQAVADSVANGRGIGVKELMKKELEKTAGASKIQEGFPVSIALDAPAVKKIVQDR